jgi:hypothetical protein
VKQPAGVIGVDRVPGEAERALEPLHGPMLVAEAERREEIGTRGPATVRSPRDLPQVVAQQPLVPERVPDAALALAMLVVGRRAHHRCSGPHGIRRERVDVVHVQVQGRPRAAVGQRAQDAELGVLIRQHDRHRPDPELGVTDASVFGVSHSEDFLRSEDRPVEVHGGLGPTDDQIGIDLANVRHGSILLGRGRAKAGEDKSRRLGKNRRP